MASYELDDNKRIVFKKAEPIPQPSTIGNMAGYYQPKDLFIGWDDTIFFVSKSKKAIKSNQEGDSDSLYLWYQNIGELKFEVK